MQRKDGSQLSAALQGGYYRRNVEVDFAMYRCMVSKVIYTDDEGNLTFNNKQVTYEVVILGGRKEGQTIPNVKASNSLGGQFNYHERIFRATSFQFSGPTKRPLSEHDGDIVHVQYTNGLTSAPVIIGCGVSPLDKDATGATKADGHIYRQQYNGIKQTIDKNGNLTFERFGGEWLEEEGYFKPNDKAESEITMTDGEINLKNNKNQITLKDGEAPSISITVTENGDVTIDNKGITMNSLADVLINAAAAFKAIAEGEVEISGSNITITTPGNAEFAGDGGTELGSAGSATNVNGSAVNLAGGGAPVARVGDSATGIGYSGVQVASTIVSGSGTVTSS